MLIEQNFELRGHGLPGRICTPITGCFHDKTIISKENFRVDCYLLLKYCRRQMYFAFPYVGQITYLQNLTPKYKIFNVFWS